MGMILYEQAKTVTDMHSAPRFGHSSNIALLASSNENEQDDYIRGVQMFAFFNLFILFLWSTVLIILRIMGPSRVGCAAGGNVLDVPVLRKKYDRGTRKAIEKRSWRVQTTFLMASVLVFLMAGLFLNKGLFAMSKSLEEIYDINDSIERVATRALDITQSLQRERTRMQTAEVHSLLNLDTFCPNVVANNMTITPELLSLNMSLVGETIQASMQEIDDFMDNYVENAQDGLTKVSDATKTVDQGITWFQRNVWKPRLAVVVLVVINIFLLIGLLLSRSNIAFNPYQCMEMYVLVPTFAVCLVLSALATYGFGAGAVVNADFCAGGEYPGSPAGTIEEIMFQQGVSQQDLLYQSFRYYIDGCRSENPLTFVDEYRPHIKSTMDVCDTFLYTAEEHGFENLSESCGADIVPIISSVVILKGSLQSIQTDIQSALDLSTCYRVSPILRRIFYGPACEESVTAFTWLFSCCLAISILGLIMLSVRAALYNATLRPERKKMTKRRLKKEFNEYKEFMAQFYHDVDEWKLHPSPEKKELPRRDSFDTDITAKPSNDTDTGSADIENPLFVVAGSFYVSTPRARKLKISFGSDGTENALPGIADDELEPLSPDPTDSSLPPAPRKAFTSFQRTSLGNKSCRSPKKSLQADSTKNQRKSLGKSCRPPKKSLADSTNLLRSSNNL